jgi:hypothetical protein
VVLPTLSPSLQWFVWILFDISCPIAFMISLIVSQIIIPNAKKNQLPTDNFFRFNGLMLHNANIWFMTFEFLTNRLSIIGAHWPCILIYGMLYVIFAWIWFAYRGFYYYFFLDYERPNALLWYIGLYAILSVVFAIFYCLSRIHVVYPIVSTPVSHEKLLLFNFFSS